MLDCLGFQPDKMPQPIVSLPWLLICKTVQLKQMICLSTNFNAKVAFFLENDFVAFEDRIILMFLSQLVLIIGGNCMIG